jgi:radical SAM superfamily enzyme with C-terminal helix-hairpin-helix motif
LFVEEIKELEPTMFIKKGEKKKEKRKKTKYFERNMKLNVDCPSLSILVPKAKGGKY